MSKNYLSLLWKVDLRSYGYFHFIVLFHIFFVRKVWCMLWMVWIAKIETSERNSNLNWWNCSNGFKQVFHLISSHISGLRNFRKIKMFVLYSRYVFQLAHQESLVITAWRTVNVKTAPSVTQLMANVCVHRDGEEQDVMKVGHGKLGQESRSQ